MLKSIVKEAVSGNAEIQPNDDNREGVGLSLRPMTEWLPATVGGGGRLE